MKQTKQSIPINTLPLFPVLDKLLTELLQSLSPEEWQAATIAKRWTVKDIAAHLLDGNLRTLSSSRDQYFGEAPVNINSYTGLVTYLNELNMSWTSAAKRLSPQVLTELLSTTGKQYYEHLQSLAPFAPAIFSVAWAGQQASANWFHIAREYTEKFIHQQQIRDAVGKEGLMTRELFYPFIDTFMCGLPHTYRNTVAGEGTTVTIKVTTAIGGEWHIIKTAGNWQLVKIITAPAAAIVSIHPDTAWKLFSKGILPGQALETIEIEGDKQLGSVALQMVSVMA